MTGYSLVPQTYGIAMAQCVYGGPRGVWLDCTGGCDGGARIKGPDPHSLTDAEAAAVFRAGGWEGKGDRMFRAICPGCSRKASK